MIEPMSESDLGPDLDGEIAEDTNLTPEQFEHRRRHADPYVDMRTFGADGLLEEANLSPAEFAERHAAAELVEHEKATKRAHRENEVRALLGLPPHPLRSPEPSAPDISDAESDQLLHKLAEEERAEEA